MRNRRSLSLWRKNEPLRLLGTPPINRGIVLGIVHFIIAPLFIGELSAGLRGLILNHYAKLAWDMPSDKEVAEGNVRRTEGLNILLLEAGND